MYLGIQVNKGHATAMKLLDFGSKYNQNTKSGAASSKSNQSKSNLNILKETFALD